jgi:phosphoribosylformylglycinamidine cyclo-ligase
LKLLLPNIKGMAHITGGGLVDNVPRVLPQGLAANFDSRAWTIPPIFQLIQRQGNVAQEEMYRVFNMGIGMVVVCAGNVVEQLVKAMPEAKVIGEVVKQAGEKRVVIK